MQRCLQLAKSGAGYVAPNPMVGAVLVYENRIIGEGYHKEFGKAHAEVNCINSVKDAGQNLIEKSVLYVSLEPCAHFGKTPPCSDLIIRSKIPKVVIGCRDPFEEVNGKGIEKLRTAGIEVIVGILEKDCKNLNKRFFTFHQKKRPYIILKWAQTADKKIAASNDNRLSISNNITNRLVHKWRSEEAAIMVGTNTVLVDDPVLTNRFWSGKNPVRFVIDKNLKLSESANIFNDKAPTFIFTVFPIINIMLSEPHKNIFPFSNKTYHFKIDIHKCIVHQIIKACYRLNIQSILVEGGAKLLQSFIDKKRFNEIRIITNTNMFVQQGLVSPDFSGTDIFSVNKITLLNDEIEFFQNNLNVE